MQLVRIEINHTRKMYHNDDICSPNTRTAQVPQQKWGFFLVFRARLFNWSLAQGTKLLFWGCFCAKK